MGALIVPELTPELIVFGGLSAALLISLLLLKLFAPGSAGRWILAFLILGLVTAAGYLVLTAELSREASIDRAEYRESPSGGSVAPPAPVGGVPPADDIPKSAPPPPDAVGQGAPAPVPQEEGLTPGAGAPAESDDASAPVGRSAATRAPPPKMSVPPAPRPYMAPAPTAAPPSPADEKSDFEIVPVFYGTDRAETPNPKRLSFGAERGRKLDLGRALVTVPKQHVEPNIERPWVLKIPYFQVTVYEEKEDPKKHFTIQNINRLTREQFLELVKVRLAASKAFKDHALIFIHGFNTSFDNAVYRTAQIAYDIKFDGAPFLYTWPSGGNVGSYTYDFGSAEQAEPYLKEFLEIVLRETGAKSLSLIAHSMGNQLLLRVLEKVKPTLPAGVKISQVILAAPDVDRDKFDNLARFIQGMASGVTLYAASNDYALGWAKRFHGGVPRAGDVPLTGPVIIGGMDTIDVTAASTDALGLNHSGYAENNSLLKDIGAIIQTGVRPPDKRQPTLILKVPSQRGDYWKFMSATAPR